MDAVSWVESEYGNRNQERTVTFTRRHPGPVTSDTEVSVMILYADPVIAAGLAAVLDQCAGFQVIPAPEPGDSVRGPPPAGVLLAQRRGLLP